MDQLPRTLIGIGLGIAALGGLLWLIQRVAPNFRPGRLPGDIAIEKPGMAFYFPITTMILVSVGLTLILWFLGMVTRR